MRSSGCIQGLVQRNVGTKGSEPGDKMAEERADGRRVTSQDAVVEETGGEVGRAGESREGQTPMTREEGDL